MWIATVNEAFSKIKIILVDLKGVRKQRRKKNYFIDANMFKKIRAFVIQEK